MTFMKIVCIEINRQYLRICVHMRTCPREAAPVVAPHAVAIYCKPLVHDKKIALYINKFFNLNNSIGFRNIEQSQH